MMTYVECYPANADRARFHDYFSAAKRFINYTSAGSLDTDLDDRSRYWPAPHFHDRTLFDSSHVEYANVRPSLCQNIHPVLYTTRP